MIAVLFASLALAPSSSLATQDPMVTLSRKFVAGQVLKYQAKAVFTVEQRQGELLTFLPSDTQLTYDFGIDVQKVKQDGIVDAIYTRPSMTVTEADVNNPNGETDVAPLNMKLMMEISPVNEILDIKDLNAKKKPSKPGLAMRFGRMGAAAQGGLDGLSMSLLTEYIGELQRVAFFVGPVNAGLDIAPGLPLEDVKKGDTWNKTATYTPQKLSGQDKTMVQRLDYTYRYDGVMKDRDGKSVHRIHAELKLDTDVTEYAKQIAKDAGINPASLSSSIKDIPVKVNASIDFDLDLKSMHTIRAVAVSKGGFSVNGKGAPLPVIEQRFGGKTTVILKSMTSGAVKTAVPTKTTKPGGKKGG